MITKGEWNYDAFGRIFACNPGKQDHDLANVKHYKTPEGKANAHLIAASPLLLAACEKALEFIGRSNKTDWDNEITPVLEQAIAAAQDEPKQDKFKAHSENCRRRKFGRNYECTCGLGSPQ